MTAALAPSGYVECRLLAQGGRPFIRRIAAGVGLKPDIAADGERVYEMTS
jgi:hypothetical protein